MLTIEIAERLDQKIRNKKRYKVRIIGLGNALFWAFTGFVTGYLLAAVVAAPIWNRY